MHLFVSAGEPSGDIHAASLARILLDQAPDTRIVGFGGERLAATGAKLMYPLTDLAVMWVGRALWNLPTFLKLGRQADVYFRSARPDAVVLIDYPGFNFALAKRAHRARVPVFYFVPPQLWGWAGWRVVKIRKWVDTVLTALPFEENWYRERGVHTQYIGHPYFDELAHQQLDTEFLTEVRRSAGPLVTLLPGSRNQEVTANLPTMLRTAARVRETVPDVRFAVAAFHERHAIVARNALAGSGLPATVHVGRTPELIEAADACVSVSGSVSLELLYRLKPTTIVYKIEGYALAIAKQLKTAKYITLVNLLADRELFPEFLTATDPSEAMSQQVIGWLRHPVARQTVVEELRTLRSQVAVPGACERAATYIRERVAQRLNSRKAA
ncbi:MAG: lipid-A-disaccharide synthase [Bacteroidales bacterium]|nr:lipid-A-disaccharide synthase [Bacteroidales bacterium]